MITRQKEVLQMHRIIIRAAATVCFLGVMAVYAYGGDPMGASLGRPSSLISLVGTHVFNFKGMPLGRVTDFVIDSQGHATFVILAHGGFLGFGERETAVPFSSFGYDRQERHFVLDLTKEKLDGAPMYSIRDLYSEKWAKEDYRYFGQAPYWTEGELVEKGITPPKEPARALGDPFPFYYFAP